MRYLDAHLKELLAEYLPDVDREKIYSEDEIDSLRRLAKSKRSESWRQAREVRQRERFRLIESKGIKVGVQVTDNRESSSDRSPFTVKRITYNGWVVLEGRIGGSNRFTYHLFLIHEPIAGSFLFRGSISSSVAAAPCPL